MLWKYAQEPINLDREQQMLIEDVCPQLPEPAGCSVGVLTWWQPMSQVIFSPESDAQICQALEPACELPGSPLKYVSYIFQADHVLHSHPGSFFHQFS